MKIYLQNPSKKKKKNGYTLINMTTKKGVSKNHKILKILCFSLIFSTFVATPILISSCSKKTPPTPNPTEYIGNWDGSDWHGHDRESENLTMTVISDADKTASIANAQNYKAHDLVIPWKVEKVENDGTKKIYDVTEISAGAFDEYDTEEVLTGTLTLPNTLKKINGSPNDEQLAFGFCIGLTKINFGNSIEEISTGAFYWCCGLSGTMILPDSVKKVGWATFCGCDGLTGLILGSSIEDMGFQAFIGCSGVDTLIINSWTTIPTIGGANTFDGWNSNGGNIVFNNVDQGLQQEILDKLHEWGLPNTWQ